MPMLTLTFNLPDEQPYYERARLGSEAISALWNIDHKCSGILKHGEPSTELRDLLETIRNMIPPECLEV